MGACLVVESRLPTWSPQMDLNGSATVSSTVDSAGGSSNKTRSLSAELRISTSHESAWIDLELQSLDMSGALQQRTRTRAISTPLAVLPAEFRSFSFNNSLMEVITGCLLAMNRLDDVVSIILEEYCKKDVWKNGELSRLVEEYFGNRPDQTLHTCTMTLEKFLNEVQLMALRYCFEEEEDEAEKGDGKYACRTTTLEQGWEDRERIGNRFSPDTLRYGGIGPIRMEIGCELGESHGNRANRFYLDTLRYAQIGPIRSAPANHALEELRNLIKAAGDSFGVDQLQSVRKQEFSVMKKLDQHKQKVDKKLESIKTWRKVSTITFASAFAAVLIGSVVAAAMAASPVAAALTAAASIPVGSMGKWFDSLWKKYEDALEGEKELISAIQGGTRIIAIMKLDGIRLHLVKEIIQIDAILAAADSSRRDEEAVKIDIGEIKRKLGDFMNNIQDLGKQVDECTGEFTKTRIDVLQKIIKYPVKK